MINIVLAVLCLLFMIMNAFTFKEQRIAWTCAALMAMNWLGSTLLLYARAIA